MPSFIQRSFAGGEISPAVYGRADQSKYATGLRTCKNFIVQRFGGLQNRAGLEFVAEVKDSASPVRLIPFIFNDSQTYVLELGNLYLRVYKDGVFQVEIVTPFAVDDDYILNYAQSADTIIFTSPSVIPQRLSRLSDVSWTIAPVTWSPSTAIPTGIGVSGGSAGSTVFWSVTAIAETTFIESLISPPAARGADATSGSPVTLTWTAQAGIQEFSIYKQINGIWGFIGLASGTSFVDDGITPDTSLQPPTNRDLAYVLDKPTAVSFHQQRLVFGGGLTQPERVVTTRIGDYFNIGVHSPLLADDSLTIGIAGRKVSDVRGMVPMGQSLVVLTASAEYTINGDQQGLLTPTTTNVSPQSYNGSSYLEPLSVGDTALFVQARGTIVRDLQYEFSTDGYRGRDLTVYAQHLVDGYTIRDWAYAQTPQSIVWSVRSDGILLGLTYVREHDVWGWHRHDTQGTFEQAASIPNGDEDQTYFVVQRTVGQFQKRFIERMVSRRVENLATDARFLDSHELVTGRRSPALGGGTVTVTGTTYAIDELVTITASVSQFTSGNIGDEVWLTVADETIRIRITDFVSGTIVGGYPSKDMPLAFQAVPFTEWGLATTTFAVCSHLEGETVSVLADGLVHPDVVVNSGEIVLTRPHVDVVAGLRYDSDMQTLSVENLQGETLTDKRKRIKGVTVLVQESRGFFAGSDFDSLNLRETKLRAGENYNDPIALRTGPVEVLLSSTLDDNGSVAIRNSDPLPLTILSVVPNGIVTGD